MFTLIGSLILIFKELILRFVKSADFEFYRREFDLSNQFFNWFGVGNSDKEYPLINSKTPGTLRYRGFSMVSLTMSYFHWKYNQLSSAIKRFTVLFGMGRSGTASLWSSGKGCVRIPSNSNESFALARNEARIMCTRDSEILFRLSVKKASRL